MLCMCSCVACNYMWFAPSSSAAGCRPINCVSLVVVDGCGPYCGSIALCQRIDGSVDNHVVDRDACVLCKSDVELHGGCGDTIQATMYPTAWHSVKEVELCSRLDALAHSTYVMRLSESLMRL